MSELDPQLNYGERLSFYKLFVEKKYKVEIPIIQRDYAQGRASVGEVRDAFLDALFNYLNENKADRDLDFVYGSLLPDGGSFRFVPLDGQQRLTTLFLLHWYLAQQSGNSDSFRLVLTKDKKSLFSYETRTSSSEFCDALMTQHIDFSNLLEGDKGKKNSLSKTIQDRSWFYLSWINDPTIQSMLTMLDAIHEKFAKHSEFYERLIDLEHPIITFLFLNLPRFGLTDDLYIKMNARGKPLTGFENFKAKFEQCIKTFKDDLPRYKLIFRDKPVDVDGYEYFIHKIDTNWAYLFWEYRNVKSKDDTFDDELMNFIRLVIANHYLVEDRSAGESKLPLDRLFGKGGKLKPLSFLEYHEHDCLTPNLVKHLIQMMDLLYHDGVVKDQIHPYLNGNSYYSEHDHFQEVLANETTYPTKLRFHAFYMYLAKGHDLDKLLDWMRVVYNLTENTVFNTTEEYKKALVSLHKLSQIEEPVLEALKTDVSIDSFLGAQVLEEKIKAHLIVKSEAWKTLILKVEQHPFFRGQIGFVLSFSEIVDFYQLNKHCSWNEVEGTKYFESFKRYAELSLGTFDEIYEDSSEINYAWERAVLSKGIYLSKASVGRWNLLSTRGGKNNIARDHSWKRLLRISESCDPEWVNRQGFVKAVFDDPDFKINQIEASLELICEKSQKTESAIEEWRKCFIQHPDLFKACNQGFIVWDKAEAHTVILLKESKRCHYHSEMYSLLVDQALETEGILPFTKKWYHQVRSREENPCATVSHWTYNEHTYAIDISYSADTYTLRFFDRNMLGYENALIELLNKQDFKPVESSYHFHCFAQEEVVKKIKEMCAIFQEFCRE